MLRLTIAHMFVIGPSFLQVQLIRKALCMPPCPMEGTGREALAFNIALVDCSLKSS